MSLILSGTDGLSDVDGTAATPAIRGTDANTGIFFPAADTIAFSEGGVEAARIDSSGNLGIGTSSAGATLSVVKAISAGNIGTSFQQELVNNNGANVGDWTGTIYRWLPNNANTNQAYIGAIVTIASGDTKSDLVFGVKNSSAGNTIVEAMRISSGNLGIGTTNANPRLIVKQSTANTHGIWVEGSANDTMLRMYCDGTTTGFSASYGSTGSYLPIAFLTSGSERMRIDTSGNLLVGTTSNVAVTARTAIVGDASTGGLAVEASGSGSGYPVWFRDTDATSASQQMVHFRRGASNVGFITTTNTTTSYGSASDYRLKEDITPMTGALAKVALFKPCTYKWKIDGSVGEGFIAHELQEVCPIAVHGTKDGIDADGKPDYQAIDTSFLVATLTAAIQEQQALITQLTTRITALEGA
jgi:hypothetical protein